MLKKDKTATKLLLDDAGFTLLEIIAVLVILSILAVVAVPKYFDLQEEARKKAVSTALAEGIGRVNGYFAQQVLGGFRPAQIDYTTATLGGDMGDFTLTITGGESANGGGGTTFDILVTGNAGTPVEGITAGRTVTRPGSL